MSNNKKILAQIRKGVAANHKINPLEFPKIRASKLNSTELGHIYGVSPAYIRMIKTGKRGAWSTKNNIQEVKKVMKQKEIKSQSRPTTGAITKKRK